MEENLREYRERGYTIIRQSINIDELYELVKKAIIETSLLDIYYEADNQTIKRYERILYNFPTIRNTIEQNDIINAFLRSYFQEGYCLFKDKLNPKHKYKGTGWKMHFDGVFHSNNTKQGWYDYASEFVNVLIPLSDCNESNGTLQILDRQPNLSTYEEMINIVDPKLNTGIPKKEYYDKYYKLLKPLNLKKGDIVFFDAKCLHMSLSNKSDNDRYILYLTYNKISEGDNYLKYYEDKKNSKCLKNDWEKLTN